MAGWPAVWGNWLPWFVKWTVAPRKIEHKDTIIAEVEPTRDAALWRQLDHVSGPDWMGDGVCVSGPDWPDHIDEEGGEHCADLSWQSEATLGFLICVLASARRLRPLLEMAANPHHARDFYVELYIGLSYEPYDEPTSGLIVRSCMKWPGTRTVKPLVESIEHWNRNVMRILPTEGSTGRGGLEQKTQQPSSTEIDRLLQQDCAKAIIKAFGTNTLRTKQIAMKAGYAEGGHFKQTMKSLKRHGIIINAGTCIYRIDPQWYERLQIRPDQKDRR